MRNLSAKVVGLVLVALLALLGLVVLAVVQGRWDALLVGVIGVAGVGVGVVVSQGRSEQAVRLKRVAAKLDVVVKGVSRLEDAPVLRMAEGSQERQIAETAARFDWLARRHTEQAAALEVFRGELEGLIQRQHREVLARLELGRDGSVSAGDDQGIVGS